MAGWGTGAVWQDGTDYPRGRGCWAWRRWRLWRWQRGRDSFGDTERAKDRWQADGAAAGWWPGFSGAKAAHKPCPCGAVAENAPGWFSAITKTDAEKVGWAKGGENFCWTQATWACAEKTAEAGCAAVSPVKNVPHRFDLKSLKIGDDFLGCPNCWFRYDPVIVGKPVCPECRKEMNIYTVTRDDAHLL